VSGSWCRRLCQQGHSSAGRCRFTPPRYSASFPVPRSGMPAALPLPEGTRDHLRTPPGCARQDDATRARPASTPRAGSRRQPRLAAGADPLRVSQLRNCRPAPGVALHKQTERFRSGKTSVRPGVLGGPSCWRATVRVLAADLHAPPGWTARSACHETDIRLSLAIHVGSFGPPARG
jgi:hypothetical protein